MCETLDRVVNLGSVDVMQRVIQVLTLTAARTIEQVDDDQAASVVVGLIGLWQWVACPV